MDDKVMDYNAADMRHGRMKRNTDVGRGCMKKATDIVLFKHKS